MANILRVVIDTNLIISAILSARGASAKFIDWLTQEEDSFQLLLYLSHRGQFVSIVFDPEIQVPCRNSQKRVEQLAKLGE